MYDKDFAELVKIAAEKLKEDTVYKMLTRSEDYQKESDARAEKEEEGGLRNGSKDGDRHCACDVHCGRSNLAEHP